MQRPGTHLWLFILSPLDEEDYHTVAGNEAEKFPRFYDSPLPGERYPRDQNWSYSSHCRDGYLLSECCFGFSIRPTTKSHAEKPSCSAGAVCHVTGHFSTHCTNWPQLRPSFISASQIHPILLNFVFQPYRVNFEKAKCKYRPEYCHLYYGKKGFPCELITPYCLTLRVQCVITHSSALKTMKLIWPAFMWITFFSVTMILVTVSGQGAY